MNVYSDSSHSALKYLKDTEVNISNFSDNLMTIADSFNLELSFPTHNFPTRYSDLDSRSNLVIDLMFS